MVRTRPSFIDYGLDIRDKLRGEHADVASLLLERRLAFPARAVCCYAAFTAAVATATVVSRISGKDWVTHDLGSIASVPITDRSLFLNRATQLFLFLAFVMGGIQGCALVLSLPRMTEARRSVEAVSATQSPTERLQSLLRTYEALAVKESRFAALIVGVLCLHGAVAHLGLAMDWFPLFFHQGDTSNPVSNYCLGATDAAAWAICLSCTWPRVPTSAVVCTPLVIYANYSLINVLSVWQSQVLALTSAVVVLTAVTYAIFLTQGAVRQLRWTGKGGGSSDPPGRMVRAFTNRPNGPCRRAPSDGLNAAADVEHGQPVPTGTSFSATSISSSSTATAASSVPVPVHRGRARARVCRLCCCCRPSPRHQEAPDTRPPSMSPINPVQAMTNKSKADDALFSDVAHSHLAAARRLRLLGAAGMISLTVFSVLHFLIFLASQFMDSFGVLVLLHAFIVLGFLLKGIALPILLVQFVLLVRQRLTASLHNAGREAEARHRIQQQRGFLRYVCHEVRVPLNTISMGTDAIGETLQDLQGSVQANSEASTAITTAGQLGHPSRAAGSELAAVSEAQYLLRSVHTAARSLDTLVGDVLQMEKIELGKFDIEPERVDIKTILEDLVASFEPDASRRGCHLHFVWATPPGPVPVIFGPSRNSNRVARVRTRAQGMWLRAWSGAAGPHGPVQEHARRSSALAASLLPSRAEDDATTRRRGSATFDSLASDATDVLVDPNRVHQVVANLVSNALKFADGQVTVLAGFAHAPPGGPDKAAPAPTPKLASLSPMACQHRGSAGAPDPGAPLSTGTARRDSSTSSTAPEKRVVCIAVCDNGIGLRKGEANQLFRAFAQIRPGASQSGKGTGLGLAICHAICGLHGGTISAWSPGEGAGSVFWLALPVLVFPSRSAPNSTPAPGLVASAAERKTKDAPPLVPDMGERAEWGPEGSTPTVSPRRRGVVATAGRSPTTSATRRRGGTSDAPPQAQCPLSRSPVACAPRKGRSGSCRTELIGSSDLMPLPEQGNSSPVVGPPSRLSTHATMQAEESDSGLGEGADAGAGSGPGASPVRVQSPCHPRDVSRVVTASSIVPLRPAQGVEAAQGDVATGEAFDDREAAHHLNLPPASSRALAAAAPTAAVPSVSTATAATAAAVGPAPAASASPPQERPLRGARMLVVEDSRSSRELLVRMLGRLGATSIDEAENGAEALDVMQREKERGRTSSSAFGGIHAVLTDSNMPVMSGQEAVQIMRQMGYQGTVVGVTGAASDGEVEAFRAAGADTVVPKPVKKEALLSTLLPILPALGQVEAGPNPT